MEKTDKSVNTEWGYQGNIAPKYWASLCTEFSECGGKYQSPINIENAKVDVSLKKLSFDLNKTKVNIVNNGHTIMFIIDEGSFLSFENRKYELLQFHYHTLSEHTLNKKYFAGEIHFVYRASERDLLVIAVFIDEGNENGFLSKWIEVIPEKDGEFLSVEKMELINLLPENKTYYCYDGSLTTPPCPEIVTWIVLKYPVKASAYQIEKLSTILANNFRPVMPINDRKIGIFNE